MGSLIQNTVFGKSNYKINTYIGGVASSVNTPTLLAVKLGISANRIKLFRIIQNNIECAITGGTYSLIHGCWLNSTLTYYIDKENLMVSDVGRIFRTTTSLLRIQLNGLTNAGDESFTTTRLTDISLPNVKTLTGTYGSFRINPNLKRLFLPEAVSSTWVYSGLDSCTALEMVYIPKLPVLRNGAAAGLNNYVFSGSKMGFKIYASPLAQTSYLGGVDKDIAWAIANRNAVVRYVTDFTKPNSVTDLTSGTVTPTQTKLIFTPPSSANDIEYYECYANGIYKNDIKNSGDSVIGLIPNTTYNITIVAVDIFYNKSAISNTINITTAGSSYPATIFAAYKLANGMDSTGGFSASVGSTVTFSTGTDGNAANFNNTANSFISIPDNDAFSFNRGDSDKAFSIKFNLKLNNLTDQWIVNKRNNISGGDEWQIIYYLNTLRFTLFSSINTETISVNTTFPLEAGIPYNIIATYDGTKSENGLNLYINGVLANVTKVMTGTYLGMPNGIAPVKIGQAGWTNAQYRLNGTLDELYFFNEVVNTSQIAALQTNFSPF